MDAQIVYEAVTPSGSAGSLGERYSFDAKPILPKLIVPRLGQLASQDFDAKVMETIQKEIEGLRHGSVTWRMPVDHPGRFAGAALTSVTGHTD